MGERKSPNSELITLAKRCKTVVAGGGGGEGEAGRGLGIFISATVIDLSRLHILDLAAQNI